MRTRAQLKRVYYDFKDMLDTNPSGNVPYTPSIPLLYGLRETLSLLRVRRSYLQATAATAALLDESRA